MAEETENRKNDPPPLPGDDATLVVDPGEAGEALSADELRRRLGLPEGDAPENYGDLKTIGLGGMGAVFSGCEPGLMREVALKMLRPAYRWMPNRIAAFIREARTTAQINHPNIVPVYRIGVFEGAGVYFAMKRVRGETLRAIIAKLAEGDVAARKRYTLRRLLEIFISACNGVAFAHHRGVVHCDLKPANLMVGDYGEVLVMDWGMAQYRENRADTGFVGVELGGEDAHDRPGTLGGTPVFMAPELLTRTRHEPDELTDVYSLGAILYCILTWRSAPYPTDLPPEELQRLVAAAAPVAPGRAAQSPQPVPREIEAIALKAMARNRDRRYQSVGELIEDLHNYLDGYPVRAYSPNVVYRGVKWIRRHPLVPLAVLAAVVTWVGVRLWQDVQVQLNAENLFSVAEYNYQDGVTAELALRRNCRMIAAPQLADSVAGNSIRAEAAKRRAVMIDHYNAALELMGRIPDPAARRIPRMKVIYRDIFRGRLATELMSGDDRAVRETLAQLRSRWGSRFAAAVAADPVLRRTTERIDAGIGKLEISCAAPGWNKLELRSENGDVRHLDLDRAAPQALDLPSGSWTATFTGTDGRALTVPLRISAATALRFAFSPPERIEPGCVCIPAREEMASDGTIEIGGMFQISRTEVSIEEYLRFWKTLPPDKKKKYRAVHNLGGEPFYIWDDAGNVRPPRSPHQPVTGITGEAASEYCKYLAKRLGRKVSLPRLWQWRRAARGADGRAYPWGDEIRPGYGILADPDRRGPAPVTEHNGDISPYGAVNLAGNVREFALPSNPKETLVFVLGGSYLLPPRHSGIDAIQFRQWSDRADDIGFRCVIEE